MLPNAASGKRGCRQRRPGRMIADMITVSRMLFSLLLLISTFPYLSAALYLLCGVTDVLDGFAARRLHTESEHGARLDSAADLVFAAVYAVKVLPRLPVPLWAWIWTAAIAAAKVTGILISWGKAHRAAIGHSFGNRLTGALLFLLPLSARIVDVRYGAALVCAAATAAAVAELVQLRGGRKKR